MERLSEFLIGALQQEILDLLVPTEKNPNWSIADTHLSKARKVRSRLGGELFRINQQAEKLLLFLK